MRQKGKKPWRDGGKEEESDKGTQELKLNPEWMETKTEEVRGRRRGFGGRGGGERSHSPPAHHGKTRACLPSLAAVAANALPLLSGDFLLRHLSAKSPQRVSHTSLFSHSSAMHNSRLEGGPRRGGGAWPLKMHGDAEARPFKRRWP